jgi:hypothetical protein
MSRIGWSSLKHSSLSRVNEGRKVLYDWPVLSFLLLTTKVKNQPSLFGQFRKTFHGRNLLIYVISLFVPGKPL